MPMLTIVEADDIRTKFEAAVYRVGSGMARTAFSRALNSEGRKAFTAVKRALRDQTSIKFGVIGASTKFRNAGPSRLETAIEGRGRHIPLMQFGAKQFSYGVRAKVWGKSITYPHTFIVKRYGGVYRRTSAARFPIKQLYGPSIPVEIVKDESREAFLASGERIAAEAMRLLGLMVSGIVK